MTARRLTAIFAADIAGYSALMGASEVDTVADLKGHQSVVLPMIAGFGGRVIDTAGDGILAEFSSVLNAVKCAIAVQEVMSERNASTPPARRMQYRIGINQGDVLFDSERIYGDGINVAARLEGICDPGGICVSSKVYDEIRGRFDVHFQDMGEQRLKNIELPVRTYRIQVSGAALGAADRARLSPPARGKWYRPATLGGILLVVAAITTAWWINVEQSAKHKLDEATTQRRQLEPKHVSVESPAKETPRSQEAVAVPRDLASPNERGASTETSRGEAMTGKEREPSGQAQSRVSVQTSVEKVEPSVEESSPKKDAGSARPDQDVQQKQAVPVEIVTVPMELPPSKLGPEGIWEFKMSGNEHCGVRSRTFRMIFRDGSVYGGRGSKRGVFESDGRFSFSNPALMNPNVTVVSKGQVKDGTGAGRFKASPGRCEGAYELRWVEQAPR